MHTGFSGLRRVVPGLVAALVLGGICVGSVRAEDRALDGVEIMRQLSDSAWATADPKDPVGKKATLKVLSSGELKFETQRGFSDTGKWWVHGDRFCTQWTVLRRGKKGCARVIEHAAGELQFVPDNGQPREISSIAGPALAGGGSAQQPGSAEGSSAAGGANLAMRGSLRLPGRFYALVIGNDDYQRLPQLKTAVADAGAVADVLRQRYGFAPANIRLLTDASRAAILGALAKLRDELRPEDRLLIYYAGHGQIDPATEAGYWQPVDADPDMRYTWIANDDIRREIRGFAAKHVLIVADSCFSGTLMRGTAPTPPATSERFVTEIDSHVSRKAITSGGEEPVADGGFGGHSIFSYYLLNFLRKNEDPYLSSFELFARIARAVANNSRQAPQFGVVSEAGDEGGGDFTFALQPGS